MTTADKHEHEARELLPWYLNGTLGEEDSKRVRKILENSEALQAEAAETEGLLQALGEDVEVPELSDERVAGIMQRLDQQPQEDTTVVRLIDRLRPGSGRESSAPERRRPLGLTGALPLALAAACAMVAVILYLPQSDPGNGDYTTLYEDRPAIPISVQVAEGVSPADANALFAELTAIDAVRQPDGSYRLELSEETTVAELYGVLTALRDDERVVSAEALTAEED